MRTYLSLLLFLCFASTFSFAQTAEGNFPGCGADLWRRLHPELDIAQTRNDQAAYTAARSAPLSAARSAQGLRTLPVVVHIVHNGGPENIPDAQVQQGITQLNAAFNATFGTGVNTDIQFCLAQRDPSGQATSGITRNQSALTSLDMELEDLALKDLNRWAPACYINIWVVAAINSASSGNGVVGYAYLPSAHGLNIDGIVMEAAYFGSSQANTGVLVHEMGHYLGLYHTFEGGCGNDDCLLDGDRVCDTPPDQTTFSSCNPNANSCNTDADDASANNPFSSDVPDLGEDYMDYSSLQCFSKFTAGQGERMNWHITHVRSSLLACLSCQTPCQAPLAAVITLPATPPTITTGSTLNLSASAANAGSYAWSIGAGPAFATTLNASYTFNATGVYCVKFRAISGNPSECIDAVDSVRVTVTCDAQAIFSVPPVVLKGNPTTFVNNSTNAVAYEWIIDNTPLTSNTDLTYTFANTGVYQLCLRAANPACADTLCATVYVQQNIGPSAGCDNTFIQALPDMGGSQPNIFPHPSGDFFATGLRNDSMVIVRFDQSGAPLWATAFRFKAGVFQIGDMVVDASGDLIGVAHIETGFVSDVQSAAFRYNIPSNSFIWVQYLPGVRYSNVHALNGDKCVVTGTASSSRTQLAQLDKNTGSLSGYNLEGESGDFYSTIYNGALYGTCRRYYNAGGDFRASVFAHDLNTGNFKWQNSIISRGNTSNFNETRMYPVKPVVDDNQLVIFASGDLEGFDVYIYGAVELVAAKTTLSGDVLWTKEYRIAGYDRPVANAILPTATGYYMVCNLYQDWFGNFTFGVIIKTDKDGNVQWAKRLGISGKNIVKNIMERNGYLYLTMSSDSYAPNDLLLVKLDQQGQTNTACSFIEPVAVEVVELPNIQDQRDYSVYTGGPSPVAQNAFPAATVPGRVLYCNTPCICNEIPISAGADTAVCQGQPVTLQASPGFDAYLWSPAASLNNPNIQNPVATPTATTTYAVEALKYGIELVENGDFSQGNTGFTTDYIFGAMGYGHYWVTGNPTLYNAQWHIPSDHSAGADNLMLLFDGAVTGNFPTLWQQTVSVQPNTPYTFQFWGAMAYYADPPRIQVTINGVVAGTFTLLDGNAMVGIWQPFSLKINTDAATQLNIVLTDLNNYPLGNDFALDDISLRTICHYTDSVTVTANTGPAPSLDLGPDIMACENAVHSFDAGAGFDSYLWQDGSTARNFTAFAAGIYWVTVRDSCGGIQQDTVQVLLSSAPELELGADKMICAGDSTQLSFTSNGVFTNFNWSPANGLNCTLCPAPGAAPTATTVYYLAASTADGCTNLDSITVIVNQPAASVQNVSQCANAPFFYNGKVYAAAGTYLDTLTTPAGCDSVVTTHLVFVPLPVRAQTVPICPGHSVTIDGKTYTQAGTVIDTIPGTVGCDTIVTYTLVALPQPARAETIAFCPGETVIIGGKAYTQAGTVIDTIPGAIGCDTIATYTLQALTPAPSSVSIACPGAVNIAVLPGSGPTVAHYDLPEAISDCPCPGISMQLTAGLPPGSAFPPGTTPVCYTARDSCGQSASCCFNVIIREGLACDIKEIGCLKYELLTITADPGQNYTYRIRVTNNCTNKLIYTAIQLPDGITAIEPADFSTFEAESGRKYTVRNPNFTPFYSIRFKSTNDSIAGGQAEIFEYTLPAQAVPTYIHVSSRLVTQVFYEAHLNTFNCPVGVTPAGNEAVERASTDSRKRPELRLFPNPSAGEIFADLSAWTGERVQLRVFNAQGQQIRLLSTVAAGTPYPLRMSDGTASGLYTLEIRTSSGVQQAARFVLQR